MTRGVVAVILLFMAISGIACGQQSRAPLTNSDVIQMTRAGVDAHTIVLAIQKQAVDFDISTYALIRLKKAGVTQAVIDAMLTATRPATEPAAAKEITAEELLDKALNAFGSRDQLLKVHAIRWDGNLVETVNGNATSSDEESLHVYPDRIFLAVRRLSDRSTDKLVMTRQFSYLNSENLTRAVGPASAEVYRQQIQFDPVYIAQHSGNFALSVLGLAQQTGSLTADSLKISLGEVDYLWKIDSQTGRLLSIEYQMPSGSIVTREYSDYRKVGDLSLPFKWRTTQVGRTVETTVNRYEVNPEIDESLFLRPDGIETSDAAVSFRVLDSQSVAHADEMDGSSAHCQLSQSVNTTVANPLDDVNFVKGTIPSNLQMTCNAWLTTPFWPRKLNAMLVMASDGNAYIVACDKESKSKCAPIQTGQLVNGVRVSAGIEVSGTNAKGKPQAIDYSILQTKALP